MTGHARRAMRAFAVAVGLFCATGAAAQSGQGTADKPPETTVVSPTGVDMVTGRYKAASQDLSIGTPETGGITYQRVEARLGNRYLRASNWYIGIAVKAYTIQWLNYGVYFNGGTKNFEIQAGPSPNAFTFTGWESEGAVNLEAVADTLKYTDNDGTIVIFDGDKQDGVIRASSVTHPNGIAYSLVYDSSNPKRLRRVVSNTGYQLILEYAGSTANVSKACVFNASIVGSPGSPVCPVGVQTATYTYDGAGLMASVTTADSATRSVVTSTPSNGTYTETYFKPGYSTPELVNNYVSVMGNTGFSIFRSTVVGSQVLGDGHTFAYQYDDYDDFVVETHTITETGRGAGWTENNQAPTALQWERRRSQVYPNHPGPLFIGPVPQTVTNPVGISTQNFFDYAAADGPFNHLISRTKSNNGYETYTYDTARMLTRVDHSSVAVDADQTTSFTYSTCTIGPSCSRPLSVTDPRGNVSDYTYDATHGGILTETLPAATSGGVRPQKRYAYSQHAAAGGGSVWLVDTIKECRTLATCAGTADEVVTSFNYGTNLQPSSQTVAAGDGSLSTTTSWTYDASGNKLTEDGPAAGTADTTRWRYDAMRRVVGVVTPDPDGPGGNPPMATRNTYDLAGRLLVVETGTVADQSDTAWANFAVLRSMESGYDIMDRKLYDRQVAGGVVQALTQYSYDSYGRLECTAVRMNPAYFNSPPTSACTLGTTGTSGPDRITRNSYDLAGQLLQIRKAVGTPLEQAYATYTYTYSGKQELVIDAGGNKAQMVYDGYDRLKEWHFPQSAAVAGYNPATPASAVSSAGAASSTDYEAYTYDANGNRLSLRKRDGRTLSYSYDALNRVTTKFVPDGGGLDPNATRDIYYGYDLRGLQLFARYDSASGSGITNTFDALGRLTSATSVASALGTLTNQYDASGNRTRVTHGDGVYFDMAYDGLDRLVSASANGGPTVVSLSYDAQGRRTGLTSAGGSETYGYDAIGRPTTIARDTVGTATDLTTTLGYNPASQIVTRTRNNDAYAWTGYAAVNRAYAVNGLNQYTDAGTASFTYDANGNLTSDGTTTFTYDVENRLVATSTGATISYDPLGRANKVGVSGSLATRFVYDGDQVVQEIVDGAIARRYLHGTGEDDPLLWYEGAGLTNGRALLADQQGSITAVAPLDGSAVTTNSYDEYGIPAAGNLGRFQYTGQAWLPELGMYYYKARIYSPTLGRFLQTDPIGYKDQVNLYAYVANDPVNGRDPDGQWGLIGAAIGGGIDLAVQVGTNLAQGQSVRESVTNVDLKSVAVSALAGATGVGLATVVEKSVATVAIKTGAITVIGAATNAAGQVADNAVHGRPLGQGVATAAAAGAVGARVGRGAGAAAAERSFARGTQRISPGATNGSKGLATSDARRASEVAANRTAAAVEAGIQTADKIRQQGGPR